MHRKRTVLFLQLPALDNDVRGPRENIPLAGIYLQQALETSPESRHFEAQFLPPPSDELDNAGVLRMLADIRPAVIACTLYLWNIERSLRILAAARARLPGVAIAAGGPEVFQQHPFLLRAGVADIVAVGEGEPVFPHILRAFRGGPAPDFATVGVRSGRRYTWGRRAAAPARLAELRPYPAARLLNPNAEGVGYLETARGCPMRCSFCRYHHLRNQTDYLAPAEVARRAARLAARGAREIKFTDPTFNAHPRFDEVLQQLARVNRSRRLAFYAELRADTLTARQADLLAGANFTEIEVGMQSMDPMVLRAIRRPTDLAALADGLRLLTRRGVKVTLDVMYGLPLQDRRDVLRSIAWGRSRRAKVQGMQTLLLPGTELRQRAAKWGLAAPTRPPYGVLSTSTLSRTDVRSIENLIRSTPGLPSDSPAVRFVGYSLPDLFAERCRLSLPLAGDLRVVPGIRSRRAILLCGVDLFARRQDIVGIVRQAVREEPDALWQFVLVPEAEEPLDLIDLMADALSRSKPHWLDRTAAAVLSGRLVARRVFVLLRRGRSYDPAWAAAAEDLLARRFC